MSPFGLVLSHLIKRQAMLSGAGIDGRTVGYRQVSPIVDCSAVTGRVVRNLAMVNVDFRANRNVESRTDTR